jgi:hypothetical protein
LPPSTNPSNDGHGIHHHHQQQQQQQQQQQDALFKAEQQMVDAREALAARIEESGRSHQEASEAVAWAQMRVNVAEETAAAMQLKLRQCD